MKLIPSKTFIVVFLLSIFLLKGIGSMSTLQCLLNYTFFEQELPMNTEEERSEEKGTTKILSEKEFVNEHSGFMVAPAYTIIITSTPSYHNMQLKDVFPSIITPPPRC
jgi:hypothetical protein